MSYLINNTHLFHFKVSAIVQPVKLNLSTEQLRFSFSENELQMFTTQTLRVTNPGNATAKVCWIPPQSAIFSVSPLEAHIPPNNQSVPFTFTYTPCTLFIFIIKLESTGKTEEERVIMRVEDGGDDVVVRCIGSTPEVKCTFVEKSVELGSIPICRREERYVTLKNNFKYSAVFEVAKDTLPPFVDVQPEKGKVVPEHSSLLKVTFLGCKDEREIKDEKITVNLRGGKPLVLPFAVTVVLPKISVLQDKFDFGSVITLGNSAKLEMTLANESNIRAVLVLDLREKEDTEKALEGVECLDIVAAPKPNEEMDETSLIISISDNDNLEDDEEDRHNKRHNNRNPNKNQEEEEDEDGFQGDNDDADDDDEENSDSRGQSCRFYKIFLKPHATASFFLKFTPKTVKNYQLELPLILAGFGKMESLCKPIFCKGLKPRFLMEPHTIEFRKKIITSSDKCVPSFLEITISNPDAKSIFWKFDTNQLASQNKVFQVIIN